MDNGHDLAGHPDRAGHWYYSYPDSWQSIRAIQLGETRQEAYWKASYMGYYLWLL